jgi:hypothetical protein
MNKLITRAIVVLTLLALLVSCQQLFTTSLGTALARKSYPDLSKISLNEALLYLADARADSTLATALVAPLHAAALGADPASSTYDRAATALVDAVVISSGIGTAISSGLEAYLSGDDVELDVVIGSIVVSSASIDALQLVAGSPPPSMTATQAYTAAATLMVAIIGLDDSLSLDDPAIDYTHFQAVEPDLYASALALFTHAQSIDTADSIFGSIFGSLPIE